MTLQATIVTIDCAHPQRLAGWWVDALGGDILGDWGDYVVARVDGVSMHMGFQRVPEPKSVKNRCHLDFRADDRIAEVERLGLLGAEVVGQYSAEGFTWSVLRDPEGNEFCVGQSDAEAE